MKCVRPPHDLKQWGIKWRRCTSVKDLKRSAHRHHGAHRCRQDHHHRAHPVLHGHNRKVGETHDGGATTDWMEQEKGAASPSSAAVTCYRNDNQISIIDTRYVDFTVEVERPARARWRHRCLRRQGNVEPSRAGLASGPGRRPRILRQQMDKLANFEYTVGTIIDRLGAKPLVTSPRSAPRMASTASSTC